MFDSDTSRSLPPTLKSLRDVLFCGRSDEYIPGLMTIRVYSFKVMENDESLIM